MIRFVTGTDTGVGKTVVAAALVRAELAAGRRVAYCKPVQTGARPGEPGDAAFVAAATGVPVFEMVRLLEPLAPAVAAERTGTPIDLDALVTRVRELAGTVDVLVVEGAGGVLVPVAGRATMADLAARLGGEVVVVARPGLGTLNHTALTLEALRTRGLTVTGIVVAAWPAAPGVVERTNLARLGGMAPVLGVVPFAAGLDPTGGNVPGLSPVACEIEEPSG